MCDFIRQNVPQGAELRIWTEPVDVQDRTYISTARLRDSNQILIWDDDLITDHDHQNPKKNTLVGANKFIGSIRATFLRVDRVRVFNEIWVNVSGVWRQHGKRKVCEVFASAQVSVADVFIYVRMA